MSDRNLPRCTEGIGLSLVETAERLNLSRARVWQLERRALQKLAADPVLQQYARELLGESANQQG